MAVLMAEAVPHAADQRQRLKAMFDRAPLHAKSHLVHETHAHSSDEVAEKLVSSPRGASLIAYLRRQAGA